jgi:hypothetical protein
MAKKINPEEKIVQRSVGFKFRQIRFFNEHPEFKPDIYCRDSVDAQIKQIDPKFLENGQ